MDELSLTDFFAVLRRWKNVFLVTSLSLILLSFVVAESWSNYRSTALIQIEQPEISANAMNPSGANAHDIDEALADQRVSTIEQKVTSTASLVEIITKLNLYPAARRSKPISSIAEAMRKKIKIELISSTLANPAVAGHVSASDLSAIAFKLSFDYSNPLLTQQTVDELTTRFLDEDLKERRTETGETAEFLAKQINVMESYLSDQEKKIADYQKVHGISNPNMLVLNQQAATSVMMSLQNLDSQITTNEGNIGTLRSQLATIDPYSRVIADGQVMTSPSVQLKALQAQYTTLSAQYGPEHPDVIKIRSQIDALKHHVGGGGHMSPSAQLKAQIADARTNLAAATETYGPQHPDVIALQEKIEKLEDDLAHNKFDAVDMSASSIVGDADNPSYLQTAAELRGAEEQRKSLIEQRKQLAEQQQNYQKLINNNPQVEQEMAALSRDYENAQMRYRELKEKKMTADMDVQLQSDRKGQRLTLIDPPELPLKTQPARSLLILGGLIAALLGGLTSVIVAQTLSGSVIGAQQLERIAGAAPLVVIPHILTSEERKNSLTRRGENLVVNAAQLARERLNQIDRDELKKQMNWASIKERAEGFKWNKKQ